MIFINMALNCWHVFDDNFDPSQQLGIDSFLFDQKLTTYKELCVNIPHLLDQCNNSNSRWVKQVFPFSFLPYYLQSWSLAYLTESNLFLLGSNHHLNSAVKSIDFCRWHVLSLSHLHLSKRKMQKVLMTTICFSLQLKWSFFFLFILF